MDIGRGWHSEKRAWMGVPAEVLTGKGGGGFTVFFIEKVRGV